MSKNIKRGNTVSQLVKDLNVPSFDADAGNSTTPEAAPKGPRAMHYDMAFNDGKMKDGYMRQEYEEILHLDPKTIRIPEKRDRFASSVTIESCKDTIDSISAHGQLQPGIVRHCADNGDGKRLELVVGARRLFACAYLNIPFIARIKEMSDFEVKIAQDIENAVRSDISPYERGVFYAQWLADDFDGNLSRMTEVVKTFSRTRFLRLIQFGLAPELIVNKSPDITKEYESDYRVLRPLILNEQGDLKPEVADKIEGIPEKSMNFKELTLFLKDALTTQKHIEKRKPLTIKMPNSKNQFKVTYNNDGETINVKMKENLLTLSETEFTHYMRYLWLAANMTEKLANDDKNPTT